jgi:hypothetical protein
VSSRKKARMRASLFISRNIKCHQKRLGFLFGAKLPSKGVKNRKLQPLAL